MIEIKDQKFRVAIEMTGISRKQAALILAAAFDTKTQYKSGMYHSWVVADKENRMWEIADSNTINNMLKSENGELVSTTDSAFRVRLISPTFHYSDIMELLSAVSRLNDAGAVINESCGLAVQIDGSIHNRQSLKNLLTTMYSKEDMLFRALQVNEERARYYCQKVREPMLIKARKLSCEETADLTALEKIWYEGVVDKRAYNWTQFHALNLHSLFSKGAVEFRMFRSSLDIYELDCNIVMSLALSAQAINQRSAVMKKTLTDNEKFTMRTFLIRLGLNGDEYSGVREYVLRNLDGDGSYRFGKENYKKDKPPRTDSTER